MIRIGVDVGGTNTDAVVMKEKKFLGGAKSPTTKDILTGVENAIQDALDAVSYTHLTLPTILLV